jgi:hypothetical protein
MPSNNVTTATPTAIPDHLKQLFDNRAKATPAKARLIFSLDATASRQPTWDLASSLTDKMFGAIANGLNTQLVYFRGHSDFFSSRWLASSKALSDLMQAVTCRAGITQIERVLGHIERENAREKVAAAVFIGDAYEEVPSHLYFAARRIGSVPLFMFQEGHDQEVAKVFATLADISGGAFSKFDAESAQRLAELLRAVAIFATGGCDALRALDSDAARALLTQIKK